MLKLFVSGRREAGIEAKIPLVVFYKGEYNGPESYSFVRACGIGTKLNNPAKMLRLSREELIGYVGFCSAGRYYGDSRDPRSKGTFGLTNRQSIFNLPLPTAHSH